MDGFFTVLAPETWVSACLIAIFAGFIKGVVGFALPTIMIAGLGSFVSPELALAGLIVPTLVTNLMQVRRAGFAAAKRTVSQFRWFLTVGAVCLILGAQLVPTLSARIYSLVLGIPIAIYAMSQLAGWVPARVSQSRRLDSVFGAFAGVFAGLAGVWGPPTVAYLTALDTPKTQQIQIQGIVYFLGAVLLVFAHITSGILTWATFFYSACLTVPAAFGMVLGTAIQDRTDQTGFRRATLAVLLLAGLNLVRRGVLY